MIAHETFDAVRRLRWATVRDDHRERYAEECKEVERQLREMVSTLPQMPPAETIRMHAVTAIDHLWQILALAMIEAERKLVRKYLRTAEIHPNQ